MINMQKFFAVGLFLICAPALAEGTNDPFQEVATRYLAAKPKPAFPEEARKYKVQAEFAVQEKRTDKALELYGKALEVAPWWPEGHFALAVLLGEKKKYRDAMREMKRYQLLAPNGADAREAQDKIYQWESVLEPEAGKVLKDCPMCPEMVEIAAGSFEMGSSNGEANEKPVHRVTIANSFAIGKTEVTQAQWRAVMGGEPSYFSGCEDSCPVEQVSWDDVQVFIQKLNAKSGKHYRLPSEAEWEYACRAGSQSEFCGGDVADKVAWSSDNSGSYLIKSPHPVATKQPNAFGLHDMSGNVWEWVEDGYHDNYNGAPADGSVWAGDGSIHVLRGGSWGSDAKSARAAVRSRFTHNYRDSSYGFRLARTLP